MIRATVRRSINPCRWHTSIACSSFRRASALCPLHIANKPKPPYPHANRVSSLNCSERARSEQFNDETRLAWGYGGLGLLAMCKGQSAEARRKLEQAIEVCQRHGLMERLTVARINLVELYHYTGNFRKGLQISDQAVTQAREVRYQYGVGLANPTPYWYRTSRAWVTA